MIRIVLILISSYILSCSGLHAQITVKGSFVQDTVQIGSPVEFILSVSTRSDEEILAVPRVFLDSVYSALQTFKRNPNDTTGTTPPQIADFEVLGIGQWTDNGDDEIFSGEELKWKVSEIGGQKLYENSFTFRMWDPGNVAVIFPPILYSFNGAEDQYYEGGQAQVFIAPPPSMQGVSQDSLDVAPIKPILTEAKNLSDYLIYLYILGALLLLGLGYWLFSRWAKIKEGDTKEEIQPEVIIPAHEKALESLGQLKSAQLWQQGKVKEYQSRLTFIIRDYLENRYDLPALESTTDEIVKKLQSGELQMSDINSLKRILQVADLVKFAKAKPDESIHDTFMNEAIDFVQRTKENIEVDTDE